MTDVIYGPGPRCPICGEGYGMHQPGCGPEKLKENVKRILNRSEFNSEVRRLESYVKTRKDAIEKITALENELAEAKIERDDYRRMLCCRNDELGKRRIKIEDLQQEKDEWKQKATERLQWEQKYNSLNQLHKSLCEDTQNQSAAMTKLEKEKIEWLGRSGARYYDERIAELQKQLAEAEKVIVKYKEMYQEVKTVRDEYAGRCIKLENKLDIQKEQREMYCDLTKKQERQLCDLNIELKGRLQQISKEEAEVSLLRDQNDAFIVQAARLREVADMRKERVHASQAIFDNCKEAVGGGYICDHPAGIVITEKAWEQINLALEGRLPLG